MIFPIWDVRTHVLRQNCLVHHYPSYHGDRGGTQGVHKESNPTERKKYYLNIVCYSVIDVSDTDRKIILEIIVVIFKYIMLLVNT